MKFTASTRQQDAFLPYVERGTIRLIGAATENPSFEIISALLSRCRVYVLEPLSEQTIEQLLRKALDDPDRGLGTLNLTADDDALEVIAGYSSGDCRSAYNTLEVAAQLAQASTERGAEFKPRVEPSDEQNLRTHEVSGHDFSRAKSASKKTGL